VEGYIVEEVLTFLLLVYWRDREEN